jgi:hypothetical protein
MNEPEQPRFTGWHRRNAAHPWRRIVQSEGEDECWAMLLAATAGGDVTVLRSSCDPNRRQPAALPPRPSA